MESLSRFLNISPESLGKILLSVAIFFVLTILRIIGNLLIKKRIKDVKRVYLSRRMLLYVYSILLLLIIGPIWMKGIASLSTVVGLASAGVAIAMHDTIANIAGWFFIMLRRPFKVGDRIQIGDTAGDVIDIRFFQFSVVEIGNWVDADQSTGRIVHVPNSKVLRESLANYHIGFEYIWNEIPVLVTFESNWKKARDLFGEIARNNAEHLSQGAREQIRNAAEKYLIFYEKLTPIIFTTVKESGILLTIRYLVNPRERRKTEQHIWEAILDVIDVEADIELAYPTTRVYLREPPEKKQDSVPE